MKNTIKKIIDRETKVLLIICSLIYFIFFLSPRMNSLSINLRNIISIFSPLLAAMFSTALITQLIGNYFEKVKKKNKASSILLGLTMAITFFPQVIYGIFITETHLDIINPKRHIELKIKRNRENFESLNRIKAINLEREIYRIKNITNEFSNLINRDYNICDSVQANQIITRQIEQLEICKNEIQEKYKSIEYEHNKLQENLNKIDSLYSEKSEIDKTIKKEIIRHQWGNLDFLITNIISLLIGILGSYLVTRYYSPKRKTEI